MQRKLSKSAVILHSVYIQYDLDLRFKQIGYSIRRTIYFYTFDELLLQTPDRKEIPFFDF